jgi:iron complex outermembrane receptor protein
MCWLIVPSIILAPYLMAQEADEEKKDKTEVYEELVVTGSRARPRSATESMVPIDVIAAEEFTDQGDTDLTNQLRNLVPSFNVNAQPISDAATVVRPANLRGLAPDHTLVLINGKRRHRAAVIYWLGNGIADGAQGPDISGIPSIALRQVEVLRDGASAQYGSDAIAGVMNFMLKDNREGYTVEVKNGSYKEGDGDTTTVSGNFGLPLGSAGFANLSFEYGNTDPTDRSVQRDDAAALIAAGNTAVANPAQIWGTPEIEDELKLWGNFGLELSGGKKLYAHTNYVTKTVTGGFFFRNPNTRSAVFSGDGGETLLVGDLLDAADGVLDGSAGCPEVRINNNIPDPTALAQVFANDNCFSFQELFPGGFTPNFGGDVEDIAITGGIKGITESGMFWDVSASHGSNEVDFFIFNTVNASLGPATPTEFDPGLYKQTDLNFNVDISYPMGDNANFAAGAEYRDEIFEIGLGQVESYEIGPGGTGFLRGFQRFPWFQPPGCRQMEPQQHRPLRGSGTVRRELEHRCRRSLRGLRRFRHDHELQVRRPLPLQRNGPSARKPQQRVPCPHPGPVQCLQRLHRVRPEHHGSGQQRHDPLVLRGCQTARRQTPHAGNLH